MLLYMNESTCCLTILYKDITVQPIIITFDLNLWNTDKFIDEIYFSNIAIGKMLYQISDVDSNDAWIIDGYKLDGVRIPMLNSMPSTTDYKLACMPYIKIAINTLLYLCSDKPDVEIKEKRELRIYDATKKRTKKEIITRNEIAVQYVKRRKALTYSTKTIGDNHNHISTSYWRKGHWHLYWTGKGRTIPKMNWIAPTFCGTGENSNIIKVEKIEK